MNAELLYEALSDGNSLEALSEHDLKRLVSAHPYFSIGQLLLAKKYRASNNKESYQQQREHLQAFYRNPWWLYYQLELSNHSDHHQYAFGHTAAYQPGSALGSAPAFTETAAVEDEVQVGDSWLGAEASAFMEPQAGAAAHVADEPAPEVGHDLEEQAAEPLTGTEPFSNENPIGVPFMPEAEESDLLLSTGDNFANAASPSLDEPKPDATGTLSSPDAFQQAAAASDIAHHRHGFVPWPGMEEADDIPTLMGGTPAVARSGSSNRSENESGAAEAAATGKPEPYLPYMVTEAVKEQEPTEVPNKTALEAAYLSEPEDLPLDESDSEEAELKPSEQVPLIKDEVLPEPPPAFPSGEPAPFPFSITPLAHDFTFEPLHTVDYFASQGIKLELDENPTDNLSRHLKSFTEWLKTMKRISPLDRREDLDAATEAEIQLLASSANHQREAVVTESMAHVWVLQGKINKAIEVYNKLSLQHPEKRAYFASKIEHLNRL